MASLPAMGSGANVGMGASMGGAREGAVGVGAPSRGQSLSLPRDHRRKEPLGQANHVDNTDSSGDR